MNNVLFSIRRKIIFLTCGMTLFATTLISIFAFYNTVVSTKSAAMDGLANETKIIATKFKNAYEHMSKDTFIALYTPPIKGIIRTKNNRIDAIDGSSTYLLWKKRLEAIFISIMETRPYYTQMRYIGIDDNGLELVRVNKTYNKLVAVDKKDLQPKGDEDYFIQGIKLKPNQLFFSEVTYNREYGKIDGELIPTIRSVVPVYDGNILFGLIVINANYEQLLEYIFSEIKPNKTTFITNNFGDYAEYDPETNNTIFEFHNNYRFDVPQFIYSAIKTDANELSFMEDSNIAYFVKLNIETNNPDNFLGIITKVPYKKLLHKAYIAQLYTLILALSITAFCFFIAIYFSRKLTSPLMKMAKTLSKIDLNNEQELLELPIERSDEIGNLARTFVRMTKKIQRNEIRIRAILNNVLDGIISIDDSGNISSFNPACEKMFQYKSDEVIGKDISLIIPNPKHTESFKSTESYDYSNIVATRIEVEGKRKDETVFPMDLSISETIVANSRLFTCIIRDITERKQMEKMKNDFISTVNHELRTPLTSILGSLGLLLEKTDTCTTKLCKRLLTISYDNCKKLSFLVNDILDVEKIAAGKMEYKIEKIEICSFIKDIAEHHQSYAEKHQVTFKLNVETPDIFCEIDGNRFNQALVNLLSNASKFSPAGEDVLISITKKSEDRVCVSVKDNGDGIPEEFQSKIFEKFAQADSSSTKAKGGSGLGLNITKSIIEAFNGEIGFETEKGKGTTFYFILPICKPEQAEDI
ncbi:MAG: ATP-binding protein [Alphaproteobacteria bacterium]